jgi:2-oxoisovalerate ferredoxin oxidoreductase beta subunit
MAELIATLDGPAYVERVALFDIKTRKRAARAIEKALRLQVERRGFSFVEVLAECPTHLRMTGMEAEAWVRDHMTPVYPLGVLKDEVTEPWFNPTRPNFDPERLLLVTGALREAPARYAAAFPEHIHPVDIALKFAGSGGDGAQTAALLVAKAALNEGFDATHIPSYGPESRGGTSYADVHIARHDVLSPAVPRPHILVAFNGPSLARFGPTVESGGTIIYDSTVIAGLPVAPRGVRLVPVPFTSIAQATGNLVVKNIVALGALDAATQLLPRETLLGTIRRAMGSKPGLLEMNEDAFLRGVEAVLRMPSGAVQLS